MESRGGGQRQPQQPERRVPAGPQAGNAAARATVAAAAMQ
jgi:hypothetical protein